MFVVVQVPPLLALSRGMRFVTFLSTRKKEAAAAGKSGSFLFLLVSLFLPEAGLFPNGLLKAQSSLADILA